MTACSIEVIGSGVAGLCCARVFAERGCQVLLRSASNGISEECCSWWAGGMLAPWCELESAEPLIASLGEQSTEFWKHYTDVVVSKGSLVVASARDRPEIALFASKTDHFQPVDASAIARLEPELSGRFDSGLFFEDESHLDPRKALQGLLDDLLNMPGVQVQFNVEIPDEELAGATEHDWRIDCRGLAARQTLRDLRGVRGEMVMLKAPAVSLSRPVRLLHPRFPLYIVPRDNHVFMVGATMLESDDRGDVSVRSLMELLNSAYALHPGFAEASVLELGADVRPAFRDNLPKLRRQGRTLYVNGLYRHGFLCAPAMAYSAASLALDNVIDERVVDEHRT